MDPLRWLADFVADKHWHASNAEYQIQIWYTAGTYDHLNLGSVAAMKELARQTQSYVGSSSDPDNVSLSDSRFYNGSRRAGNALVPSLQRHVAGQSKESRATEPAQRRFRGRKRRHVTWWNSGGSGRAATVPPPEARSRLLGRMVQGVARPLEMEDVGSILLARPLTRHRSQSCNQTHACNGHWTRSLTQPRNVTRSLARDLQNESSQTARAEAGGWTTNQECRTRIDRDTPLLSRSLLHYSSLSLSLPE